MSIFAKIVLLRYCENRRLYMEQNQTPLPMPEIVPLSASKKDSRQQGEAEEKEQILGALDRLRHCHFIVIDTPGSYNAASQITHSFGRYHRYAD